jgi:16S rRNA C967 or C1407 C5-methylase (RsmB/RsmF family)
MSQAQTPRLEPSRLLQKLSDRLFSAVSDRDAFLTCLLHPQPLHPCILWCHAKPDPSPFPAEPPVAWQPPFCDRLALGQQPGKHPLHAAGAFYCLDFSSVFAISPLLALPPAREPEICIDLCAAPGGKSIFAWRSRHPQLLISNEVVGKRRATLEANLRRCHVSPAIVTQRTPQEFATTLAGTAHLVLVDAPCSGQSLLAKGDKADGCFHPVTVKGNAKRQKRILADAAQLVAGGGGLVYSTCTYSPEENEQVVEWLLARFPQFEAIAVPHLAAYQSTLSSLPCYRLFPQSGLGAGAFTVLLRNQSTAPPQPLPKDLL